MMEVSSMFPLGQGGLVAAISALLVSIAFSTALNHSLLLFTWRLIQAESDYSLFHGEHRL